MHIQDFSEAMPTTIKVALDWTPVRSISTDEEGPRGLDKRFNIIRADHTTLPIFFDLDRTRFTLVSMSRSRKASTRKLGSPSS